MGTESSVGLRTHVLIYAALVVVFAVVSGGPYLARNASREHLHSAFRRDIALLTKLTGVRGSLRRLDFATQLEIATRQAELPARRGQAAGDVRRLASQVVQLSGGRFHADELAGRADRLIRLEDDAVAKARSTGSRRFPEALARERDAMIDQTTSLGDDAVAEIQRRMEAEDESYYRWFAIRLAAQFTVALLVALYLYFFIVRPIQSAETAAAGWELGTAWPDLAMPSIPELRSLLSRFSEMARRLNDDFSREHQLNEFKTKLVSIAGHEFNNSLTVILNAVFFFEENATPQERERDRDLYMMIRSHARMLTDVATNFLNLGRAESGRLAMSLAPLDLSAAVRQTVERLTGLASARNIAIRVTLPAEAAVVSADSAALNMVLNNLMNNAIKYTPPGGAITAGLWTVAGGFVVFVSDTGIGIKLDDQERIMTGYYRTEAGRMLTDKGFGIGLALARQIVEAHGSRLELESEPGKGSTFSFRLDRAGLKTPEA